MPGTIIKTYNLATSFCIVAGVQISGYGENGGIEGEDLPLCEMSRGADGEVVANRLTRKDTTFKVTMMQTARAYKDLAAVMQAQKVLFDAGAPLTPLPFWLTDPATGTTVTSPQTVFMTEPMPKFGAKVGTVEFTIAVIPQVVHAPLMLL